MQLSRAASNKQCRPERARITATHIASHRTAGHGNPNEQTFSTSCGQMTLVLELFDSVTSGAGSRGRSEDASNCGIFTWDRR